MPNYILILIKGLEREEGVLSSRTCILSCQMKITVIETRTLIQAIEQLLSGGGQVGLGQELIGNG